MIPFDLGPGELAIIAVAVLCGACLQGSLGFGLGLLAAPVLVLVEPRLVPGPLVCMSLVMAILVATRERASLDFGSIRWAIIGRIPGAVLGAIAVALLSTRWLAALFAVGVLTAVGLSVAGLSVERSRRNLLIAGLVSGTMGTATSVGGPPVALVYQRASGPELRGSLATFMLFGTTLSLIALTTLGQFTRTDLEATALLVPGALVGFVSSRWTNRVLDRGYTRPAVLTFAAVSAVSILVRQVL